MQTRDIGMRSSLGQASINYLKANPEETAAYNNLHSPGCLMKLKQASRLQRAQTQCATLRPRGDRK
eukprot:656822-Lingulodinium_polyedra.AAC.1